MTYSTGIYRRLDFGINIPDGPVEGPGECVSLKEVTFSSPTRKRKISDVLSSEENSNSVSLGGKAVRRSPRIAVKALKGLLEKKQKKVKELTQEQYLRELRASKEVQVLKKLEEEAYQLDAVLVCTMVLVWTMFEGNALHDLLFDGEARNLDIEDAVESCGDDLHISSYEQAIGFDLRSGDFSSLVTNLQARASRQEKQVAIMISRLRTVAVLIWETEAIAIIDSHSHGQRGAMVGYVPHGQSSCSDIVNWYSGVMQKFVNENLGLCTLTFVSYDYT